MVESRELFESSNTSAWTVRSPLDDGDGDMGGVNVEYTDEEGEEEGSIMVTFTV